MVNKFFYTALLIIIVSCTHTRVPKYLKKEFKYKPVNYSGYNSRLNLSTGFYRDVKIPDIPVSQILCFKKHYIDRHDTSINPNTLVIDVMFFDNGLCVVGYLNGIRKEVDSKLYQYNINEAKKRNKPGYTPSLIGEFWGPYEITGDTVKIKVLYRGSLMAQTVSAYEQWYKIIDQNTLQPIKFKGMIKGDYNKHCDSTIIIDPKYHPVSKFIALNEIKVDPNYNWLLRKKWFWEDKKQYAEWKRKY